MVEQAEGLPHTHTHIHTLHVHNPPNTNTHTHTQAVWGCQKNASGSRASAAAQRCSSRMDSVNSVIHGGRDSGHFSASGAVNVNSARFGAGGTWSHSSLSLAPLSGPCPETGAAASGRGPRLSL